MVLFERATVRAAAVMARVGAGRLGDPTPCAEWTVQQLIDHMVGSTDYLAAALAGRELVARSGASVDDYQTGARSVLEGLRRPGALDRTCVSPLGFTWSIGQATAGTFMDNLIHTWDLARRPIRSAHWTASWSTPAWRCSCRRCPNVDARPGSSARRSPVPADATAQDRLLGAMGRRAVIPESP